MPKKAKSRGAPGRGRRAGPAKTAVTRPPRDLPAALSAFFLAAAFAGAALAYDSGAESSFDAPKRIVSLFGIAAAALAAFGVSGWKNPFAGRRLGGWRDGRNAAALALAALLFALVSAFVSPHRPLALDSTRAILVFALLLPLGASRVVGRYGRTLLAAFLAVAGIDAAVSILQARGIYQPFPLVTQGEREATGAFAGNVGYLALALAFAAVGGLGAALTMRRTLARIASGLLAVLFAVALLVNRNLTSLSALAAGVAVLLFGIYGRRALLSFGAAILIVAAGIAAYPPMRARAAEAARSVRAGDWDLLLSYRTGPWAAALRMARERPIFGFGPGTFGAEYVAKRLEAEIAARRRLTSPLASSTYGEAHCDYLQPFAEAGIPAGAAVLAATALLFAGVASRLKTGAGPARNEAVLLLAVLSAGAVAALTWFPLQRPITAMPLLLAAGRAWRISQSPPEEDARAITPGRPA